MDWKLTIETERTVLKRILALFLSLAILADRTCGRALPVRCLVLWMLRPAEALALREIFEAGQMSLYGSLAQSRCGSLAEARRLARCFRAAARAVQKQLKALARCRVQCRADRHEESSVPPGRPAGHRAIASIGAFVDALRRYADAPPPFVERRDSS
jgi:hypothetical protein